MYKQEDVRGDFCPVDNSGKVLEQGGACPSPPDTLAVPPQEYVTSEGVGDKTLAPRVNPSNLNPTGINIDGSIERSACGNSASGARPASCNHIDPVPVTPEGVRDKTLAPRVNPFRKTFDPALDSILDFFAPLPGVGDAPPCSSAKVGVVKPDRFIWEKPSPLYVQRTANLDTELEVIPLYPATRCKLRYYVFECNCPKNRRIVPSTCMGLDCAPCAPHVGARRSMMVLKRILGIRLYQSYRYAKKPLIYTVFTVPKSIREQFLNKAEWQKVRKKAWTLLKEYFGALYAVEATHPVGDKNPSVFHPHLNFLWVQKPGFKPFIDVNLLRKKWAVILKVGVSDVYCQYSSKLAQIVDWAQYVTRSFPGNHKWIGSMRWYGKYPKDKTHVEYVCNECGTRPRLIGYVTAEAVDNWYKRGLMMGIDPPWERDECITHIKRKRNTHADITQE